MAINLTNAQYEKNEPGMLDVNENNLGAFENGKLTKSCPKIATQVY
ncbi:MAG: hypothetical protein IPN86_05270 [Saprospiraceae bacterium]|jgi:hypothetical protein|nr:hypothetical protein [Saprospiraceae bacterium]